MMGWVADYVVGTIIVVAHVAVWSWGDRRPGRLPH
jgi:hypothetical protein